VARALAPPSSHTLDLTAPASQSSGQGGVASGSGAASQGQGGGAGCVDEDGLAARKKRQLRTRGGAIGAVASFWRLQTARFGGRGGGVNKAETDGAAVGARRNGSWQGGLDFGQNAAAEAVRESLGLELERKEHGAAAVVVRVVPGSVAARSQLVHPGDAVEEVGTEDVTAAPLSALLALLAWPGGLAGDKRMLQLTLVRAVRQRVHVNLVQRRPPARPSPTRADSARTHEGAGEDSRGGTVFFATLGLELHVAADGRTRIFHFARGGPAEDSELLLVGDEASPPRPPPPPQQPCLSWRRALPSPADMVTSLSRPGLDHRRPEHTAQPRCCTLEARAPSDP